MKFVAIAAIAAALAVPSAFARHPDAERRRRAWLHDHAEEGHDEGHEAEGRHVR